MIRLYVQAALAADGRIEATQAQVHYLKNVMRRAVSDDVILFNGRDGEWRARIATLERNGGTFALSKQTRVQPNDDGPALLIAPIKRARLDLIVEKATELGVHVLQPVATRRTNSERVNLERLKAISVEAAEQCGRLSVPAIRAPAPLMELLHAWPLGQPLYLLDETGGGIPIADALYAHPHTQTAAFLIGPEGGFEHAELDAMRKLNFVTAVGIGPRILRAETAAIAALVCYQALAGDWDRERGRPPEEPAAAPQR